MGVKTKYYRAFAYRYRFLILWVAFLIEFIIPAFENTVHEYIILELIISIFGILAGFNVLLARKKLFYFIVLLGAIVVLFKILSVGDVPDWVEYVKDFILVSYYVIIIYEIFKELVDQSKVDLNTIGAVLAGFFVIGIIGGIIFSSIEITSPGSFIGLGDEGRKISDLVYFSFVTLTTIGYGDISPVTQLAQRVTVLFGLVGNFYSTIIIGIIISKFLANKNK
ncbi:MAG: two pore domain potassium channel family protein [Flavobacteriales bacterium]|nr:two pore domain potassium channel family protein [Flavobacteriales bacterium]